MRPLRGRQKLTVRKGSPAKPSPSRRRARRMAGPTSSRAAVALAALELAVGPPAAVPAHRPAVAPADPRRRQSGHLLEVVHRDHRGAHLGIDQRRHPPGRQRQDLVAPLHQGLHDERRRPRVVVARARHRRRHPLAVEAGQEAGGPEGVARGRLQEGRVGRVGLPVGRLEDGRLEHAHRGIGRALDPQPVGVAQADPDQPAAHRQPVDLTLVPLADVLGALAGGAERVAEVDEVVADVARAGARRPPSRRCRACSAAGRRCC